MARGQGQREPSRRTRFLDAEGEQGTGGTRRARDARGRSGNSGVRAARSARDARGADDAAAASPWYRPTLGKILLLAVLIAAVVFGAQLCSTASSINVSVNGTQYSLRGDKTLAVALKESGLPINPGDFISLSGQMLKKSGGDPFLATVNGEETADPDYKLKDGDVVTLVDGKDVVEPYDAVESPVPHSASIVGLGAVHTFTQGNDGVLETRTGQVSGEVIQKQTVDPVDLIETRADPDVGDRKIIALTFDGGPSLDYTASILDLLSKNNAKATFFCRGDAIQGDRAELVRREAAEGHQVCTHSYDDAELYNGEMSLLTPEQLADEVTKGLQAIADALGTEEEPYVPSKMVRVGGKDLEAESLAAVVPLIDAEIGWTLDTGDWVYLGEDDIYDVLISAKPGDIVRMHDGGTNQEATIAALERALPKLAKKGYTFVTLDEMLGDLSPSEEEPAGE